MNDLSEVTNDKLAAMLRDGSDCGYIAPAYDEVAIEAVKRLSNHPAQQVADLTGCVVTMHVGFEGECIWVQWAPNGNPQIYSGIWNDDRADNVIINLPPDPRPWQECIYRPRGRE